MPFTVPNVFNVTNAAISNSKGYFQRTTALSKSQATAAERRGEDVQVFWRALERPNLHIPRLSRGSCRQGAADRGIFSFPKIREQRLWRLILSVLCLFVPFWAPKRKDRNDWLSDCNKWLRVKTTAEYKSKHHIMVMDSSINRIVEETYIELTLFI